MRFKDFEKTPVLQDIPVIMMINGIATENVPFSYHFHASRLIDTSSSYEELKDKRRKALDYGANTMTPAALI